MSNRMTDMPEALVREANALSWPSVRISFYYIAMFGTVGVFAPFLPIWLKDRSLSAEEIGIVMSAIAWTRVMVNPLAAHVADVTGRRRRLALMTAAGACVGLGFVTQSYGFFAILAALIFTAACQGPVLPVGENLCLLTIRARNLSYGRLRAWGSVAFIAVVTGAGYWLETAPSDHVIYMLIGGWLLILFSVAWLPDLRSPPRGKKERRFQAAPAWALLRNKTFILLLAAVAANMSSHAVLNAFSSIHWIGAGISESSIGYLWSIGVLAEIILFWMAAPIVAHLGPGWLMALGAAGGVIRWIGLGWTTDFYALLFFQTLHGLTFGAAHLGAMTYLQRHVPAESSATGQALYSALGMGAALALMQPIAGWLYAKNGGGAFYAMAILAAVGFLFAVLLAFRLRKIDQNSPT
jgi:PPP family 3-phenylpropionic acid transporter